MEEVFNELSKTISPILSKKIFLKCTYLACSTSFGSDSNDGIICRFNGSLLQIKISGLNNLIIPTVSSLKFSSFMKDYYNKINDIISIFDGEVIKISNNSIYIVWMADSKANKEEFSELESDCIQKAVHCGLELNKNCNNYIISESEKKLNSIINIEVLISHGLMGGISINTISRKEFTFLGSPISELSQMEEEISDLVIKESYLPILMSNVAHYKFHTATKLKNCYCFKTSSGNYIVLKDNSYLKSEILNYNNNDNNNNNNMKEFKTSFNIIKHNVMSIINSNLKDKEEINNNLQKFDLLRNEYNFVISKAVISQYTQYIHSPLKSEMFNNKEITLEPDYRGFIWQLWREVSNKNSNDLEKVNNISNINTNIEKIIFNFDLHDMKQIISMSVKIKINDLNIVIDSKSPKRNSIHDYYNNLSGFEKESDFSLIRKSQECIDIVTNCLQEFQGYLIQISFEEKSIICQCVFGLFGSRNFDSAANSIDCSQMIVEAITDIRHFATIGISSGKAYCGLHGFSKMKEYVVIGSAVDISTYLMNNSRSREISCDETIKKRDRRHTFIEGIKIQISNTSDPISSFRPVTNPEYVKNKEFKKYRNSIGLISQLPFMMNDSKTQASNTSTIFEFGREKEGDRLLDSILPFFAYVDESIQNKVSKSMRSIHYSYNLINDIPSDKLLFNFDSQAVSVLIEGSSGIGKSYYLEYIRRRLVTFTNHSHYNITVFDIKSKGARAREPYGDWITTLSSIIDKLCTKTFLRSLISSQGKDINNSNQLDTLSIYISDDLKDYLPLLIHFKVLVVENSYENEFLTNSDDELKRLKFEEIITEIVTQFIKLSKNILVFLWDDLHEATYSSLNLVTKILMGCTGIVFVETCKSTLELKEFQNNQMSEYVSRFTNSCRHQISYLKETLCPLDKAASNKIIESLFTQFKLWSDETDESYLTAKIKDYIYMKSGGNPVYLLELTNNIIDYMKQNRKDEFELSLLEEVFCNKIEQSISSRFGCLNTLYRIILSIASVASIDGSPFDIPTIIFLFEDSKALFREKYRKEMENDFLYYQLVHISNFSVALRTLIGHNQFIEASGFSKLIDSRFLTRLLSNNVGNDIIDISTGCSILFEFDIDIEKRMIYEMLDDNERRILHASLGSYLTSVKESHKKIGTKQLFRKTMSIENRIAYHFQLASQFKLAMVNYYESAVELYDQGSLSNCKNHLQNSYVVFMDFYNNIYKKNQTKNRKIIDQCNFLHNKNNNIEKYNVICQSQSTFDKDIEIRKNYCKNIADLFIADSSLLEICIKTQIKLAQLLTILHEDLFMVKALYETLFDICFTINYNLESSNFECTLRDGYYLMYDSGLCFSILSGMIFLYNNKVMNDLTDILLIDNNEISNRLNYKELSIFELYQSLGRTSENFVIHFIMNEVKLVNILISDNNILDALNHVETIIELYRPSEHSNSIVQYYSIDIVLNTILNYSQQLFLLGDVNNSLIFLRFAQDNITDITNPLSLQVSVTSLSLTNIVCGRIGEAYENLCIYRLLNQTSHSYPYKSSNKIIYTNYIMSAYNYYKYNINDNNSTSTSLDDNKLDDLYESIDELFLENALMYTDIATANTLGINVNTDLYITFEIYFRGLVDVLKTNNSCLLKSYMEKALIYIEKSINCTSDRPFQIFGFLLGLILKANIYNRLCNLDDIYVTIEEKFSYSIKLKETLELCLNKSEKYNFYTINYIIGEMYWKYGIDFEKGKTLAKNSQNSLKTEFHINNNSLFYTHMENLF